MSDPQRSPAELRAAARAARAEAERLEREASESEGNAAPPESLPGGDSGVTRQELPLDGVDTVVMSQRAGRVIVSEAAGGAAPAIETAGSPRTITLNVRRDGSTVHVEVRLPFDSLLKVRQAPISTLTLPAGLVSVDIRMGAGDLQIRGIRAGALRAEMGAGQLTVSDVGADLHSVVNAGKLNIVGHRGTLRCHVGTGDAVADVAEAPQGEYRIDVGLGRAELRLPPSLDVHVEARAGLGRTRLEYPDAGPTATRKVMIESGIGEAAVRRRETNARPPDPAPAPAPAQPGTGSAPGGPESEELRILQRLEQGVITSSEAAEQIAALYRSPGSGGRSEPG